ncbi:U3 small nucleolar RNA-associated protein 18 homolog isoform X2 [Triplophysa rosa]|uniref:U3 small nucleolar RNA-associated protein 18 homolog n=1 Tax=Triplophysa rosa TaxID=992332 RepID=A0A9W7T4V0_TRIRA|nr:U3 small nucleolar RNA-associated protein 18 homolog isoform X2 [Triplophysa rosa]KAI7789968.1 U3 small nucleolar RNA-associated protein 18-like protein [Triplophysa rosa]
MMDSSVSLVKKQRRNAKRRLSEESDPAARVAEERSKQQKHAALCATLGEDDASVKLLEELVFGADERLTERLTQESDALLKDDVCSSSSEDDEDIHQHPAKNKPVWEDEEDAVEEDVDVTHRYRVDYKKSKTETKMSKQKLQRHLKEQFQKAMGGTPSWAEVTVKTAKRKEDEFDGDDELMQRTGNFIGSSDSLPKGIIKIKKCLNANNERPGDDRLTSVQFHSSAQIVMTAGLDCSVSLFQVDGKTNPKIQSIHLENFPVNKASFSADGERIVATGLRNKLFYMYDMMEGKILPVTTVRGLNEQRVKDFELSPDGKCLLLSGSSGYLHLMTMKTREVIGSMKMNGNVCSAGFTADSSKIFSSSVDGDVFIWDVRSSKCLKKFTDDGCVGATSLALSPDDMYLACGSQSGVVNVYSQKDCLQNTEPKPLKAIMNLVTAATSLCFNNTSEILAIGSRADDEANRLVHIPSFTVFSNFPLMRKKTIFQTRCVDFSPRSGFYTVANNKGHALLFRLLHYKSF